MLLHTCPGTRRAAQQLLLEVQTVMQDITATKPDLPHSCYVASSPAKAPWLCCHTPEEALLTCLHHPSPLWGQCRCVLAVASAGGHQQLLAASPRWGAALTCSSLSWSAAP